MLYQPGEQDVGGCDAAEVDGGTRSWRIPLPLYRPDLYVLAYGAARHSELAHTSPAKLVVVKGEQ